MTDLVAPTTASGFVLLVPAYKPEPGLVEFVQSAVASAAVAVVVVDDGSGESFRPIFEELQAISDCRVLRHVTNLGKGAALKTGLNYIACEYEQVASAVVTADADGQHRLDDILAVGEQLGRTPDDLVVGVRRFAGEVPFRSRLGNSLTKLVMRMVTGHALIDTQSGLRGIPFLLVPHLVRLRSNGYEFELDMLLLAMRQRIDITEVPVATIYIDENKSSHFNPLLDSARIYFVLLRFSLVSLASAILDNLVFAVTFSFWPYILGSQAVARIVSGSFNYALNKKAVFRSDRSNTYCLTAYIVLVIVCGTLSYGLIRLLVHFLQMPVVPAKILAETVVFLFSFSVQRDFIFADHKQRHH
ncbi:MAG: bifunctional glycosyltransferase family 2/GtrA family protein [bacterium]